MDEYSLQFSDGAVLNNAQIGRSDPEHILIWIPDGEYTINYLFDFFRGPDHLSEIQFMNREYVLDVYRGFDRMESFSYNASRKEFTIRLTGDNPSVDDR